MNHFCNNCQVLLVKLTVCSCSTAVSYNFSFLVIVNTYFLLLWHVPCLQPPKRQIILLESVRSVRITYLGLEKKNYILVWDRTYGWTFHYICHCWQSGRNTWHQLPDLKILFLNNGCRRKHTSTSTVFCENFKHVVVESLNLVYQPYYVIDPVMDQEGSV